MGGSGVGGGWLGKAVYLGERGPRETEVFLLASSPLLGLFLHLGWEET